MICMVCGSAVLGCAELGVGSHEVPPLFALDEVGVRSEVMRQWGESRKEMYADGYGREAVEADTALLWVSAMGVDSQADTLIECLRRVGDEGLSGETFHVGEIVEAVDSLRALAVEGQTCDGAEGLMAQVEFQLTHAMMRYVYGQRYGYVLPHKVLNNLLLDADAKGKVYRRLFDIPCDVPTDSLARVAVESVREGTLGWLLNEVQPRGALHERLSKEYRRAVEAGDTARARLARVNLERSRWRYQRPDTGLYLWINLADMMLTAVDTRRDTSFMMKVCCGSMGHKSPMLMSRVKYMEFNPYWVVPQTIVRSEIAGHHTGDSAYFARNNMVAIDKKTKREVAAKTLSTAQLLSAAYTIRQEKGAGNSLVRIAFRFPNNFSVYLHDTNQPWAFRRERRTVSHGCIRLERPYDLAIFLLGERPSELYVDRIRMTIGMKPLSEAGKKLEEKEPQPLHSHSFKEKAGLWIDYYTLYVDHKGALREAPDTYRYDGAIEGRMVR